MDRDIIIHKEYEDAVKNISKSEWLVMAAEEASELSQAALKYRRVIDKDAFPTPVTEEQAIDNLMEEMADVLGCMQKIIGPFAGYDPFNSIMEDLRDRMFFKEKRFLERKAKREAAEKQ